MFSETIRSLAVRDLYHVLNMLYQTPIEPGNPGNVWNKWSLRHEDLFCPVVVDLMQCAGYVRGDGYLNLQASTERNLETNAFYRIHQRVEQWLIENEEYDVAIFGYSDSEVAILHVCAVDDNTN